MLCVRDVCGPASGYAEDPYGLWRILEGFLGMSRTVLRYHQSLGGVGNICSLQTIRGISRSDGICRYVLDSPTGHPEVKAYRHKSLDPRNVWYLRNSYW